MSLEAALAENTAALKEVASLLKEANEGRTAAVNAIKEGAGAATTGATRGRKPKDETKTDEKPATTAKTDTKPTPAAEPTGPMTIEQFREKAGAFMNVADDIKPKRKEFVRSINEHYGTEKIVQVPSDDYAKISGWFDAFARGEKVNFSEGEDDQAGGEAEDDDEIG